MELLAIEPLSDDMLSAISKKMQELSPISFPGKKTTSDATVAKDTAAISETGTKLSGSRQPSREELNANALTADQLEEMFGESLATALGGFLNNGNYMSGVSESGVQVDIERHTEDSENGVFQTDMLDTSNVLGYSASITSSSGKLDISFVDSVWIQQMEDGRTLIYYKESDTTRSFSSDGSYTEESGNLLKSDTDSIIINVAGDVHTENGNNLIFNWADNATISTGSGNDTVILSEKMENVTISTGSGNDKVTGGTVESSRIDLGGGNNELLLNKAIKSEILAGGNTTISHNTLFLNKYALDPNEGIFSLTPNGDLKSAHLILDGSSLSLGKGMHNVAIGAAINGSRISLDSYRSHDAYGNAAAKLSIGSLVDSSFIASGYGYNLMFGDIVNSTIALSGKGAGINFFANYVKNSRIDIDAQMALLNIGTLTGKSSLTTVEGAYAFSFGEISGDATVAIGGGHTYLRVGVLTENAHLSIGNGSSLNASFKEISGNAVLTTGDIYSSSLGIGALLGNAVVKLGYGDKTVLVERMGDNATLDAGEGSALIGVGRLEGNASLRSGHVVVVDNQSGQRRENMRDLGALPPQSRQEAKEAFWKDLSTAHRVLPSVEKSTLDMFRPE